MRMERVIVFVLPETIQSIAWMVFLFLGIVSFAYQIVSQYKFNKRNKNKF